MGFLRSDRSKMEERNQDRRMSCGDLVKRLGLEGHRGVCIGCGLVRAMTFLEFFFFPTTHLFESRFQQWCQPKTFQA